MSLANHAYTGELLDLGSDLHLQLRWFDEASFAHSAKLHLGLLSWLIDRYTRPGETIADPMAGSGSLLYGASLQRHIIAREIEPTWLKIMQRNAARFSALAGLFAGEIDLGQADARDPWGYAADCVLFSPPLLLWNIGFYANPVQFFDFSVETFSPLQQFRCLQSQPSIFRSLLRTQAFNQQLRDTGPTWAEVRSYWRRLHKRAVLSLLYFYQQFSLTSFDTQVGQYCLAQLRGSMIGDLKKVQYPSPRCAWLIQYHATAKVLFKKIGDLRCHLFQTNLGTVNSVIPILTLKVGRPLNIRKDEIGQ
jgi:hypothetical protein